MDKVTLTPEQLKELKHFIYARGFREPEVQMEILDHFACKVEEKLAKEPHLDLNTAMREAHTEFGYSGFYGIKAAMDIFIRKKYKHIYWREVKNTLMSIPYLLLFAILGWGIYKACVWEDVNHVYDFLGYNAVKSSLLLLSLIGGIVRIAKKWPGKKTSYTMQIAMGINSFAITLAWILLPITRASTSPKQITITAVLMVVFIICTLVDNIASYKMLKIASNEYLDFEAQQKSLQ